MQQELSEAAGVNAIKENHWLPLVKQWQVSKESSKSFCQRLNLNKDQFSYWRRKLISKQSKLPSKFVKLEVQPLQPMITNSSLLVELPSKIKITVPLNIDTTQLVKILDLLGIIS
jgi:transposase-like protein